MRKGVRQILTQAYPNAEIGELEEGEEWADKLRERPWDIIISDLPRPELPPHLPVLILSLYRKEHQAFPDLPSAAGPLGKDAAPDELIWAVRQILAGKKSLDIPAKEN
jgi:DNA-binding NarL/FixJ family response regulator